MSSNPNSRKPNKSEAPTICENCLKLGVACLGADRGTCETCEEQDIRCIRPIRPAFQPRNKKRDRENSENNSDDDFGRGKRATSSATVSYKPGDIAIDGRLPRPTRTLRKDVARTSIPTRNQKNSDWDICDICKLDKTLQKAVRNEMIRCDVNSCGNWYHTWCVTNSKKTNCVMFSPQTGTKNSVFVCPDCTRSPGRGYSKRVVEAMSVFLASIGEPEEEEEGEEEDDKEETISVRSSSAEIAESPNQVGSSFSVVNVTQQQPIQQQQIDWEEPELAVFDLAEKEKFQGLDKSEVNSLMRTLRQSIFNYDMEICDIIKRFGPKEDTHMTVPLDSWNTIDPCSNILQGQEWYLADSVWKRSQTHTPLTAALRKMIRNPGNLPLQIDPDLRDIPFSEVHTAFIWWFVVDILLNSIDIYDLPNMKPLRVMMSAIHNFGEARWPKNGQNVLQEIQLRTFNKTEFQTELQQNKDYLKRKFDIFLEPLTRGFDNISPWSHHKDDILKTTIKLWSYFTSLRGRVEEISVEIGGQFDEKSCEKHDDDSLENGMLMRGKVAWLIHRGFRYRGIDGAVVFTQKASVIIR